MATKAQNQITIMDLTDAVSIFLSQDAITLNGGKDGLAAAVNTVINVSAYRGSEQLTPSVGTPTFPSGQTTATASVGQVANNVVPVTITIKAGTKTSGSVTIPVSVSDGASGTLTINKTVPFSIALTGQTGEQGDPGTSVTVSKTEYQQGSSNTTAPTGTWSNSPVSVGAGKYLWTRTTFSDGKIAYSVARQGSNGTNGTSPTVSETTVQYQKSTSGTTVPSGTWSDTALAPDTSNYVWTKTTITYSDGATAVSYSVGGKTGANGNDAITISISPDGGTVFKNNSGSVNLTAHVFKGGVELTGSSLSALGTLKWYKDGTYLTGKDGATIAVSASDVTNSASYEVRLEN